MSINIFSFEKIQLSGCIDNFKFSYTANESTNVMSKFNQGRAQALMTSKPFVKALLDAANNRIFVAKIRTNSYVCERVLDDGNVQAVIATKKPSGIYNFTAGVIDTNGIISSYEEKSDPDKGFIFLCSLLGFAMEEEEFLNTFNGCKEILKLDPHGNDFSFGSNREIFERSCAKLSDNMYRRINYCDICGEYGIKPSVVESEAIRRLNQSNIKPVKEILFGFPKFFLREQVSSYTAGNVNEAFNGKYALSRDDYSEQEKAMIPKIESWYAMPEFVEDDCQMIKFSSTFPSPVRTIGLVGPAGTGKTEGARAICAGLGIPYDHMTCNAQSEIFDFLGQIFPCENKGEPISYEEIRKELGMPSTEDIINNPSGCYELIHGERATGFVNEATLVVDMVNKVMDEVSKRCSAMSSGFTYVESGLIKAIRNGYGYEIQEIGSVQRAGVAVGLNALLESGNNNFITLPTGETIKKHPDCVIIFTSNEDYEASNDKSSTHKFCPG